MRILFVRHGEPDYENDGLTEAGLTEAHLLADRMRYDKVDAVYVSPMGRAQATAAPVLLATGWPHETVTWLREFQVPIKRPDTGEAGSGIPWDWLPADWCADPKLTDPICWRSNTAMAQGHVGEAYDQVTGAFDDLLAAYGYVRDGLLYRVERPNTMTLALFCHFGVTCVLLSHLMHCSPMVLWHGLCMAPSSITTVVSEERRPGIASFRALTIGDVTHLTQANVSPSFSARFCEVYGNGDRTD